MILLSCATAALVLAASAAAQTLNPWPQYNYGRNGLATDGDVDTADIRELSPGKAADYFLLFNRGMSYSGFYIQSSGDYVIDYNVVAVSGTRGYLDVGRVCGARGNFTFVPFKDPESGGSVWSDTLFIEVTAARNNASTSVINEIWPVFPNDEIVDPKNTSPCPTYTR
ncbi:hypothetical protein CCHL11_09712 [Colletotrichum chlorophyti]|uniref:Uncharacterized protein n=1 Tax=Colletotrichum chlorophyti TaxID=708187 RepID=A0A1Q8R9Q2_9PEZI|nr:hypothetical protein CCHL11_09712 [Colletotrichum chlorophyti]